MSSRSTDSVGRTGWDVLHSAAVPLAVVLVVLIAALYLYFKGDDLDLSAVTGCITEYGGYIVPLVLGAFFGRALYYRYIRQVVIVQVEDPEGNRQREYEVSLRRFETCTVESGILNPVSTGRGVPLYRVLAFDAEAGTIEAGWCHDPATELAAVMVRRDLWESLVKHDHDMTVMAERFDVLRYQDSVREGREIAASLLDALQMPPLDPVRPEAAERRREVPDAPDE